MLRAQSTIRRLDAPRCGGKAACLGELASRGYSVPSFLVLPTPVYEDFLAENRLTGFAAEWAEESATAGPARLVEIEHQVLAAFTAAELGSEIHAEIDEWMRASPVEAFAVRSSATREDLPGATFAGQYASCLNLGRFDVPQGVVRCFASLFSARAAMYRRRMRVPDVGAMAVIVQEMVRCDHAGVVFTEAPRRAGALLIECAPGLGDVVVSGSVSPSRYYFNRASLLIEDSCERHPLDVGSLRAVARQALAIEAHLGGAQDVEYGVVDGAVHILQARPANVTA